MPPKYKFTQAQITQAALEIMKSEGIAAVTARAVGAKLNASPKVIFGLFKNMEQLVDQSKDAAFSLYKDFIAQEIATQKYPAYKASGMAYIRFARQEKELFKLLFMRDRTNENTNELSPEILEFSQLIEKKLNISAEQAIAFHLQMWVFVHGIATMIATGYLDWNEQTISGMLTDTYIGLKHRFSHREEDI